LKVLLVEPGKQPVEKEIEKSLPAIQSIVGWNIRGIHPFDDKVVLVWNEEGQSNGLPANRPLYDPEGDIYHTILGTFFLCGDSKTDWKSLSQKMIEKYTKIFTLKEC